MSQRKLRMTQRRRRIEMSIAMNLAYLDNHDDDEFHVLKPRPAKLRIKKGLIILVHPGDMLFNPIVPSEQFHEINLYSMRNQGGTCAELGARLGDGYESIVLHRGSSSQFYAPHRDNWIDPNFIRMIEYFHSKGTVLYGDDLDAACKYLSDTFDLNQKIFLAGAYSNPDNGCLTHIGRYLENCIDPSLISVSKFSPPDDLPGDEPWRPNLERQTA